MQGYLAKILELELENGSSNEEDGATSTMSNRGRGRGKAPPKTGDEILGGLTDKQTKKIIEQKLAFTGKRKKGLNSSSRIPEGKTEQDLIEEQRRLFQEAQFEKHDEDMPYAGEGGNQFNMYGEEMAPSDGAVYQAPHYGGYHYTPEHHAYYPYPGGYPQHYMPQMGAPSYYPGHGEMAYAGYANPT